MLLALAPIVPRIAASAGIARRTEAPGIALTFDDGPHPEGTPTILDILDAGGAKATFFLVGEQVERHPAVAAEVAARGHQIAVHCHRHRVQLRLREAVLRATGARPALHRPPLGIYSAAGLRITREAGLQPLLWSRWGKDWRRWTTPARIARRASKELSAGDVILLHDADHYSAKDSWRRTAAALPEVLAAIAAVQPTGSTSAASDATVTQA